MTTSFKPAINLLLRDFYLLIIDVGNAEKDENWKPSAWLENLSSFKNARVHRAKLKCVIACIHQRSQERG
jgi:hypothetical protein